MTMKKGDRFCATYSNQSYVIVGKWCDDLVLAPLDKDENECLIYSAGDIEELVSTFKLIREEGCKQ